MRSTSSRLKAATGEILAGANDLSERTAKQAAMIEETSAAVKQLSSAVVANAKRAEEAAAKTQSASRLAEQGGKTMGEANNAMERITSSSAKPRSKRRAPAMQARDLPLSRSRCDAWRSRLPAPLLRSRY